MSKCERCGEENPAEVHTCTPITVEFAEGCFDNVELTEEELAEIVAEIKELAESGQLFEMAEPVSEEEWEELMEQMGKKQTRQ